MEGEMTFCSSDMLRIGISRQRSGLIFEGLGHFKGRNVFLDSGPSKVTLLG